MDQGANINYSTSNESVLTRAIAKGSDEIILCLLDNAADCNANIVSSPNGKCPLNVAIERGSGNILEAMLVNYGCDVNIDWKKYSLQNYGNTDGLSDRAIYFLSILELNRMIPISM